MISDTHDNSDNARHTGSERTTDSDPDRDTEPTPPWLASIPLAPDHQAPALLIVHPGRAVVPPEGLAEVLRFWADGRGGWIGAARASNGLWGYIDGEGEWRVPPTLQNARSFSEDGVARFCDGGRWGFLDLSGAVVIPPAFDNVQPFRNGLCAVQVGKDAWRIIDRSGRTTCDEVFHDLSPFGAQGLARAALCKKDGQQRTYGFVDRTGRWVIEPRFHDAQPFGESVATAASLDGELYGLIDPKGHWVLKPRYPHIDAFNAEGLAYFDEHDAWNHGHGYLNARGKVVVKGGRHLSRRMACGVAANSHDGTAYLMADGAALPTPPLSYGTDFSTESCYAVVRTAATPSGAAAPAHWGLLHPDGRFVPAPEHLLEPLTDGDRWLVAHPADTPLVPFLTRDGQLAFIDGEGAIPWRAHYDGQQVALLDAAGTPLWRSAVRENCWPPGPFFNAPLSDHLENIASLDGIVPLALDLLADAEARLHRLAVGDHLAPDEPADVDADEDKDEDENKGKGKGKGKNDVSDVDDVGEAGDEAASPHAAQVQAGRTVVVRRVLRAHVSASHNGPYEFLCTDLNRAVDEARVAMVQQLTARFGPADPHPEHAAPGHRHSDYTQAWPVALAKPLPGDTGAQHGSREQWLTLYKHADSGCGDVWWELWLMAAPSIDALQLAQRTRTAVPATASMREMNDAVAGIPDQAPRSSPHHNTHLGSQGSTPDNWKDSTATEAPTPPCTHAARDTVSAAEHVPDVLRRDVKEPAAGMPRRPQLPQAHDGKQGRDPLGNVGLVGDISHNASNVSQTSQVGQAGAALHAGHAIETLRPRRTTDANTGDEDDEAFLRDSPRSTGVGHWLSRQLVESALKGEDTVARRLQHRGVVAAFMAQAAMAAPSSRTPPTLRGFAGWLEQRAALALLANLLLGLTALVGHTFVAVAAWRAEGPWMGLVTFALMGFADAYWAWRFLFATPASAALAVTAIVVVVYVFGWRRLYRRVGVALVARGCND